MTEVVFLFRVYILLFCGEAGFWECRLFFADFSTDKGLKGSEMMPNGEVCRKKSFFIDIRLNFAFLGEKSRKNIKISRFLPYFAGFTMTKIAIFVIVIHFFLKSSIKVIWTLKKVRWIS